jgi:hypothetical protein
LFDSRKLFRFGDKAQVYPNPGAPKPSNSRSGLFLEYSTLTVSLRFWQKDVWTKNVIKANRRIFFMVVRFFDKASMILKDKKGIVVK